MSITSHFAMPVGRDSDVGLAPVEPGKAPSAPAARHAGAVALSRTGNLETGEFADAIVLATFGELDAKMHGG